MSEIQQRADFEMIRYAQVWEDSDILTEALNIKEDGNYLSIASAGDNVLAILAHNPKSLLALDLNETQLFVLELKVAAFRHLEYLDVLKFLGVYNSETRVETYQGFELSTPARVYFDANIELIENGINHAGKFEHYFKLFRSKVLPFVHSKRTIDALLQERSEAERLDFYHKRWNTWRWRVMFRLFFSQTFMGLKGRDKAFFEYVEQSVSERLLEHTKYALTKLDPSKNPYLHYILKGNFDKSLPLYLREEHFLNIKNNLSKLSFKHQSIEAYLLEAPSKFDGYNLSDIFEYMSQEAYEKLLEVLIKSANKDARLIYWNMMVKRSASERFHNSVTPLKEEAQALHQKDKTFFYRDFIIEACL